MRQHRHRRGFPVVTGEPEQRDLAAKQDLRLRLRKPLNLPQSRQPHHEVDRRLRFMADRPGTEAPDFRKAGDRRRRNADETALVSRQEHLVVGNQPREQTLGLDTGYKSEGELCLACAGITCNHNAAISEHDRARMEIIGHG